MFSKKIILTGFEPFAEFKVNPSEEIIRLFRNEKIDSAVIKTNLLPVDTKTVWKYLKESILDFKPDIILSLGLSPKRSLISLEKVAINLLDFEIKDNNHNKIEDVRIIDDAPDAYFSNLPLKSIKMKLDEKNIPVGISYSAGAFLCNQVFFLVMDFINRTDKEILGGFIHLPPINEMNLPEKYASFIIPLEQEFDAIKTICSIL
ncbi:pyroglutamyl-peptidase I [bacterium]|nr:pyroglutamyl-peptidase I [bacterium]